MAKTTAKLTGNHTSLTGSAGRVVETLLPIPQVSKISPGFIKAGLKRRRNGIRRVKIQTRDGYALVSVRGNTSHQEIHVYSDEPQTISQILEEAYPDWDIVSG